jgi:TonB family protein
MVHSKSLTIFPVLAFLCFSCIGPTNAQQPAASTQTQASLPPDLFKPLILQIKDNAPQIDCKPGKCKIAVTDFIFTGKGVTPFGIQLADLLTAQLAQDDYTVVDRVEVHNLMQRDRLSPLSFQTLDVAQSFGNELKADVIISGDLAKVDDKTVGFSARVLRATGKNEGLSIKGSLHIDLATVDLSSLGGSNGLSPSSQTLQGEPVHKFEPGLLPSCFYMPNPPYTEEARKARTSGIVLVDAIVGADGRLADMRIVRGLAGLNEVTLKTLATWRCKAPVRNGQPIPVRVAFQVNFKLNP